MFGCLGKEDGDASEPSCFGPLPVLGCWFGLLINLLERRTVGANVRANEPMSRQLVIA